MMSVVTAWPGPLERWPLGPPGGTGLAGARDALAAEHTGRTRLDRIAGRAELDHDGDLAQRVLAARDRVDAELPQARVDVRGAVDGPEDRADRAVAVERALDHRVVGRADGDLGERRPAVGGLDLEPLQRVALHVGAQLVGD